VFDEELATIHGVGPGRCRACNKPTEEGITVTLRGGVRGLLCFPDFRRQLRLMNECSDVSDSAVENGHATLAH
jgi:hypothetical protein